VQQVLSVQNVVLLRGHKGASLGNNFYAQIKRPQKGCAWALIKITVKCAPVRMKCAARLVSKCWGLICNIVCAQIKGRFLHKLTMGLIKVMYILNAKQEKVVIQSTKHFLYSQC
jgi:hypothetical protein